MSVVDHIAYAPGTLDEQSFKVLFDRYWDSVYAVCVRYTGAPEDSRELAQDIFFSLWRRRKQLAIKTDISAYLHGAAKLKSFEFLRKEARQQQQRLYRPLADVADHHAARLLEQKELHAQLQHCIAHLPEPGRRIFHLSREEGLSHKQIAANTGISVGMVEYYIGNALRILRNKLKLR
ncbi:MAG TPA: RNA polymerase sigma-70 factor [Chitinophaga sp.]